MTVYAYLKVSNSSQDIDTQKSTLLEWLLERQTYASVEFIEDAISSRLDWRKRGIGRIIERLKQNDIVVVADVTHLAHSAYECFQIQEAVLKQGAALHTVSENLAFEPFHTGRAKIDSIFKNLMLSILKQVGILQQAFIAKKTRQGIRTTYAKGKTIGRSKDQPILWKLDYYHEVIITQLKQGHTQSAIVRFLNDPEQHNLSIHHNTLNKWMKRWHLSTLNNNTLPQEKAAFYSNIYHKQQEIKAFIDAYSG
ncbi:recombinase family protein [Candidatus Albibeggiatoa sp. nov. NOAA]|uniref:recombinase family protein n=1 Tax=Candidatus Albibeggiatoa sp. nov. NOAA TaxID=3162724 RepID=UPI0032F1BBF2|nr:recombinase family protein [Thiotrichaceae bacterium]